MRSEFTRACIVLVLLLLIGGPRVARAEEGHFYDSAGQDQQNPSRWKGLADLGSQALERGQIDRAINLFTTALERHRDKRAASYLYELRGDA